MTARCGKKYNLLRLRIEHRGDNGYVWQVAKDKDVSLQVKIK